MTDITELAQLRAELSNPAIGTNSHLRKVALSLVETLEGKERTIQVLESSYNEQTEALEKATKTISELQSGLVVSDFKEASKYGKKIQELQSRIAELESRTVKLPAELYTIGELIRTQDNRITDQPMFVVFQKREIIGSDEHSPSRICWVWDGEEVSELRAKRLEALYQDGRDTRGYDRYAMQEVDEFVTACFTEHGCKDYLRQNGHNLRLPYIYACGSFRNNEYQLVRNWLAGIKVEVE
ncbi:hypothetical protein [Klebsiella pneumoniae]|uniref:hypothetical protein n=1 Tax=Klebsiella pneumoniae TaxID=573 RepID=UPI0024E09FE7|nr:hypothetical protein [Klebsiella pneumoniae]HCM7731732.1 ead/Ea22-like family protein [Klebsiella pneumoniae]